MFLLHTYQNPQIALSSSSSTIPPQQFQLKYPSITTLNKMATNTGIEGYSPISTTEPPPTPLEPAFLPSQSQSQYQAQQQYSSPPPMSADPDQLKWDQMEDTPGCCFADSAGCCFSSHGACCFSDHGACCFSDHEGCCFSDNKGCCFGQDQGMCFNGCGGNPFRNRAKPKRVWSMGSSGQAREA